MVVSIMGMFIVLVLLMGSDVFEISIEGRKLVKL